MKPFLIGLTGSIGMGKSTTAQMFAAEPDVMLWDADEAVHRLYALNGEAVGPIKALCPEAIVDGAVDRSVLKLWIAQNPAAIRQIEAIVHPLVAADRAAFVETCRAPICVLDIPLLFETHGDTAMDLTVVVSTDAQTQSDRVLARPSMTPSQFERILSLQMPDADKRRKADVVIDTTTLESARIGVQAVLKRVREQLNA